MRYATLTLLLFLGAAVVWTPQAMSVPSRVPSLDECFSWRLIEYVGSEIVDRTAADVHPPLYYLMLKAWSLLWHSSDLVTLRAFSMCCGVAAIAACAACVLLAQDRRLVRSRFPEMGAVLGALLYAWSPIQLEAAGTARMYAMGGLLTFASSWMLMRLLNSGHPIHAVAYMFFAAALGYTHYFGMLAVAAQLSGAAFHVCARQVRCFSIGLVALVIAVLWIPWLPVFLSQFANVREHFWIQKPPLRLGLTRLQAWICGHLEQPDASLLVVIAAIGLLGIWRTRHLVHPVWVAQILLPWCTTVGLVVFTECSLLQLRYMTFAHAALTAQIGTLICGLRPPIAQWLIAVAIMGTTLPAAFDFTYEQYTQTDLPIRQAFAFLRERLNEGEYIRASSLGNQNRLLYYAARANIPARQIRCPRPPRNLLDGHVVHVASLNESDFLLPGDDRRSHWLVVFGYHNVLGAYEFRCKRTTCFVVHSE